MTIPILTSGQTMVEHTYVDRSASVWSEISCFVVLECPKSFCPSHVDKVSCSYCFNLVGILSQNAIYEELA